MKGEQYHNSIWFKRTLFVGVVCFVLTSSFFGAVPREVQADEITELNAQIGVKKNEISDLRKRIDAHDAKLKTLRGERVNLQNQIAIIDNEIKKTDLDIRLLEVQIAEANLEIRQVQFEIAETEKGIDRDKEKLGSFLRSIHQQDNVGLIEILLTKESLSEFFDEMIALENVQAEVQDSVDELKIAKQRLGKKQEVLSAKKLSLEKHQRSLEAERSRYEENVNLKRSVLAQTRQSERNFQNLVAQLKIEQANVNSEIKELEASIRRRIEAEGQSKLKALGNIAMQWPVPSQYVTAYFHDPRYPFNHIFQHPAIDIRASQGTPVRAAESGFVARTRFCSTATCYQYVMIIHNDGVATVYGHLSKILVQEDQFVNKGEVIGLSGATPGTIGAGRLTTGPHLHFETRENGIPVNPLKYLP